MAGTSFGGVTIDITAGIDTTAGSLWLLNIPQEAYDKYKEWRDRPKPTKAIIHDPATVLFFNDGSKVVSKANGDEYDPLFGIMACALRKVGRNRVRIDAWEPVIGFLADYLVDARECRLMADMLTATADALELDGVMDAMDEYDEWTIDEGEEPVPERDEDRIARYEMTRQRIRSLVDRGEL